jgi:hypothetical protein
MRRVVRCGLIALFVAAGALVPATSAWGNAANPVANSTVIDQVAINANGSETVTVQGQWDWASQNNCPSSRNGVGYNVVWFDNQTNAIGSSNSPNGILYVGDAQDNIVHSDETLGGSSAFGNAFWNGVPSSYGPFAGTSTNTTPTQTDAANWLGDCSGLNGSGVTSGQWGPISHTYAANATQPLQLCPILYDPHGGSQNSGKSGVKDVTAGANSSTHDYNNDNSYETNGTGPDGNQCPKITLPMLTTSASAASSTGAIHDTATLTGATGSGTITFNLYPAGSGCSGTPLYTNSVTTSGAGDYQSGDFSPSAGGIYQWQASYDSTSVKGLITACGDPNEQSRVPPHHPKSPGLEVLKLVSVRCADLATKATQPSDIEPCNGTWSNYTTGIPTVSVPATGSYAIPIDYQIQVTNTGQTPLTLSLSDSLCDSGTIAGPVQVSGTLTNDTLSAGGQAYYTCTHTLTQNDPELHATGEPFTNTATVTGTPPSGPPIHKDSTVTVHRLPAPAARHFCRNARTGKKVVWRHFPKNKPEACEPRTRRPRPRPPKHPRGFTG